MAKKQPPKEPTGKNGVPRIAIDWEGVDDLLKMQCTREESTLR